jgi:hypothetical protein
VAIGFRGVGVDLQQTADIHFWKIRRNTLFDRPPSAHCGRSGNHDWGAIMTRSDCEIDLESLSAEELWDMHRKVTAILKAKITAQKKVLEHRLTRVNPRLRVK